MNRFFILVAIFSLGFYSLIAQTHPQRPNYKLLWKISGKDLKSPSYLFGTMHVQDKKAFDFSDSVLLKITECQAFALEVHPDSIINAMLSMILKNSKLGTNKFKEIFNTKDYKEMDSLLKKETGYSLEKLKSPTMAELVLQKRPGKKDKKVFLDAYLYDIAKKQGKTILGVEDVRDQLSLFDFQSSEDLKKMLTSFVEERDEDVVNPYKNLLDNYYQGDIDKLRGLIKGSSSMGEGLYKRMITDRNLKMAENIKKAISLQSTFIAVGAGHLAGEEGLIQLLQKNGYTLTPVEPLFTGLAAKYKFEPVKEEWFPYISDRGGYSISMPQKPAPLKIDSLDLTFQMYFDLGTSSLYQSAYFPISNEYSGQSNKYIFDKLEQNIKSKRNGKIEKSSKIETNGLEGREFEFTQNGNYFRSRLILRGDIIYMLLVGTTKDAAHSADAQKFFTSFQLKEFKKEQWKDLISKEGAFSISMFGDAQKQTREVEDADGTGKYILNLYVTTNIQNQETYLIRYNDFPSGMVSTDDSVYYASLLDNITTNMSGANLSQKEVYVGGFKASEFTFEMPTGILVKGRLCLRGNRLYMLLTTSTRNSSESGIDQFMNSLKFLNYESTEVKEYDIEDTGVKVKLPSNYSTDTTETDENSSKKRQIFNAIDPNSGISYIITVDSLSNYDYYASKEEFFEEMNKLNTGDFDSVISKKDISTKDYIGQDVTFSSKVVNPNKRLKIILNGKRIYQFLAYLPKDYAASTVTSQFFESPQFISSKDSWSVFTDKTDLILKDITSTDSLLQQEAESALRSYSFKTKDLPKIYKALAFSYPDDSMIYGSVRGSLFKVLKEVNDASTIDFIKTIYSKLPAENTELRDDALSVLTALKSKEASLEMLNLITLDKEKESFSSYKILFPYYDSLQLMNDVVLPLINLESKFEPPSYILSLAKVSLDSGVLSDEVAKGVKIAAIEMGKRITATPLIYDKNNEDDYQKAYTWECLADLLISIPFNNDIRDIALALQKSGDIGTMVNTSCLLLKNDIKVSENDLQKIAADIYRRITFYEKLKEIGKEKAFPSKYLTQEKFAESALYEYIEYDDGAPEKVELIGVKHINYDDQKQKLFVYKYKNADDDSWYVGISGPFPVKGKEIVLRGELTNYSYELYEKRKLTDVLKSLLEDTGAELIE